MGPRAEQATRGWRELISISKYIHTRIPTKWMGMNECVCVCVFKRLKLERLVVLVGRGGDIIIVDGMGLPCSWHPSSSMDHAIYHDDGDGDGGFKGSRSVSTPCSGHPEGPVL